MGAALDLAATTSDRTASGSAASIGSNLEARRLASLGGHRATVRPSSRASCSS
jgi:hypothetical protein